MHGKWRGNAADDSTDNSTKAACYQIGSLTNTPTILRWTWIDCDAIKKAFLVNSAVYAQTQVAVVFDLVCAGHYSQSPIHQIVLVVDSRH